MTLMLFLKSYSKFLKCLVCWLFALAQSGWNIRSLDCGNTSSIAAAEDSCISWGTGVYGELGYGPTGPK